MCIFVCPYKIVYTSKHTWQIFRHQYDHFNTHIRSMYIHVLLCMFMFVHTYIYILQHTPDKKSRDQCDLYFPPAYIRPSLQFSLTLNCIKALSKILPNIHRATHVPAPPRAPADVVDRDLVRSPRVLLRNHQAKFFLRGPWGKALFRGTQRAGSYRYTNSIE